MQSSGRLWVLAFLVVGAAGCGQKLYRAETTLHADGSVDRAIYQLREETPEAALRPQIWKGTTHAPRIGPEKWEGPIAKLPPADFDKDNPYFAAWGHFDSPQALPQHFVMKAKAEGIADGKLAVEHLRTDYVFVVEHRWRETLTDVVTLRDMHRAADELSLAAIDIGREVLQEALGPEYDLADLVRWFQTEGRTWLRESLDAVYELGVRKDLFKEGKLEGELMTISAQHGLVLRDGGGKPLGGEEQNSAVEEFVRQLLRQKLRRKDGKPLPDEIVLAILFVLKLAHEPPHDDDPPVERKPSAVELALTAALEKVIEQRFETHEEMERRFSGFIHRVFGLYLQEFLGPARRFFHTVKMPGPVAETNGKLRSDQEVEWSFEAKEAFPLGYPMYCRSLTPQLDVQQQALNRQPIRTRATAIEFVAIVAEDEPLLAALRSCVKAGSMKPLHVYRGTVGGEGNTESFKRATRLLKLLQSHETVAK